MPHGEKLGAKIESREMIRRGLRRECISVREGKKHELRFPLLSNNRRCTKETEQFAFIFLLLHELPSQLMCPNPSPRGIGESLACEAR